MKNTLLLFGLAGLTATLLSFTLIQKSNEVQEPKKSRHIKLVKIENGKEMKLDTVLTNDDVFVWNGDTINPVKHIRKISPSGFDKSHSVDVTVDRKGGKEKVMIFRHNDGKAGEPMIWNMDSDEDMEIVTENIDSVGKKIVVRKRIKDGEGNHMMFFGGDEMKHFPPIPPVPPIPHVKMMKMQHSGRVINLNDPNIISYKKKEMSGDREKIEIIRKKSDTPENINFDFEFDHAPMAPEAPVNIREFNGDNQKMKIMEKEIKIDGKKGKEIKVEVETEENK